MGHKFFTVWINQRPAAMPLLPWVDKTIGVHSDHTVIFIVVDSAKAHPILCGGSFIWMWKRGSASEKK
jgi:hypothetical protein